MESYLEKKIGVVCEKITAIETEDNNKNDFVQILGDEILNEIADLKAFRTKQEEIFWKAEEIKIEADDVEVDFKKLDNNTQTIIKSILLFFNVADKLVLDNLSIVSESVPYLAAKRFFITQAKTEMEHDIIYGRLARSYYNDDEKYVRDIKLMNKIIATANKYSDEVFSLDNYICPELEMMSEDERNIFYAVIPKINLMNKWKDVKSVIYNIVSYFIFETVGFNTIFALIRTLKENNTGVRCLADTNEMVLKDEKIHAEFGLYLYKNYVVNKLSQDDYQIMLSEISEVEIEFFKNIFPEDYTVNNRDREHYLNLIKLDANYLCSQLGCEPLYNEAVEDEKDVALSVGNKPNFFERPAIYIMDFKQEDYKDVADELFS